MTRLENFWKMKQRKTTNKILFLHGLDSRPYEDRIAILEASGSKVFCPHIIYQENLETEIAQKIIEKDGITHLVGHSLGGILAYYMSIKYELPVLMFNPAFTPHNRMYFEMVKGLDGINAHAVQYAVVGLQDDVIPPEMQLKMLRHAAVYQLEELGHKVDPTTYGKYFNIFFDSTKDGRREMDLKIKINNQVNK